MSAVRRLLQVVAFLCTLMVGVASMAVIVTQTAWFKEWLRGFIVRQAEDYVNGRLSIGRLDGNLFFGVELEDIDVTMNGRSVVQVKDVGLDYNALTFIGGHVVLDDIRLNQPTIRVEKTAEGWNLARLIKVRTPDPNKPKTRRPIEIGEIGVTDGSLELAGEPVGTSAIDVPDRIDKLNASIGVRSDEDALDVRIGHVSLRAGAPRFGINDLSGRVVRTPNRLRLENISLRTEDSSLRVNGAVDNIDGGAPALDIHASSDKMAIAEIARLVPALRDMPLQPAFEVTAKGPTDRLAVKLNARDGAMGHVIGDLTVDAVEPRRRIAGTVTLDHFNAGPIAKSETFKTDVTGKGLVDVTLPSGRLPLSGTYSIDATYAQAAGYEARDLSATGRIDGRTVQFDGNASAYGGRATAKGFVKAGTPVELDIQGQAADLDLRNLPRQVPAPRVPSKLDVDYHVVGRGQVYSGDVLFRSSTLAGATVAPGTTATFEVGRGAPRYGAKGAVSNLDLQQIGRGFDIQALTAPRYHSRLNATFTVNGSGGGRNPLNIDASGVLADSELFGASMPRMELSTNIGGPDLKVRAIGQFDGLNPAVLSGNEKMGGTVNGAIDVDTTLRSYRDGVSVDTVDASGRVNLGNSRVAGLTVDTAIVDGVFASREGTINQLTIKGPDLNVQGQGPLALNDTGQTAMTLHLDTPALDRVGQMFGQPLRGAAVIDLGLSGNARELKASGTLKGSDVARGNIGALNLTTTFDVVVPDLTPANARVRADNQATLVQIGSVKIGELTAKAAYASDKLEFDALARERERTLGAGGSVVLHPDHQEIHLTNLVLRSETVAWQTAPGSQAAIQYGNDRIALEDVRLVSGNQLIEANGAIGSTTDALKVRLENVDVAQLDQLLLLNKQISGQLNASATVSGPREALEADGTFALTQGGFRKFTFNSFGGKVQYAGEGMNVDVRLEQNPQAWVEAKGYAPKALFTADGHTGTNHEAVRPGEAVDLQIASSQIDLGVIQGFTGYVTNVTGALQANVKVTGSAHDPHANGAIEIRNGALSVPDLGTAYTGIDTRIDLTTDAVTISEMRIVDEHNKVLTVGGTLGVHERAVGAVDIKVQSNGFEVIDNKLADLKLDTDVRITGDLRAPRAEGQVEVETGTVNVAEVIALTTSDAYATQQTSLGPSQPQAAPQAATPTLFNALDLNVALSVPGNLVVKGTDLRPANAPISIGDVNVTVGGLMQIRKPAGASGIRLVGEVNTVRGNYDFQGRRFELLRDGRIQFTGTDVIDPLLDVRAQREISGVQAFIHVGGTLRQPQLSFSSNPPLDEADILALIIFNQPVNELGEGQQASLAERAAALAGGYVASGLARSIANALELDQFEIEAMSDRGGPTVTLGEQVGQNLFFRVRQGFGAAQATEFIIEYQIADYLRLQATASDIAGGAQREMFRRVERGGLDIIFFFSY